MSDFMHCHLHTEQSLLDGNTKILEVASHAKSLGQSKICITDHGTLSGALAFWKSAKEIGIGANIGVETYVTTDINWKHKDSSTWHLVLIAMNQEGYRNLCRMSRIAWTDGFYKKPRVDHATLAKYSEGIIALTACMGGEVAKSIEYEDSRGAIEALQRYKAIYGDRLYVELQPGNTPELNATLSALAWYVGVPTTVTIDSHYDSSEQKASEELLLIMQQVSNMKPAARKHANDIYEIAKTKSKTLIERLNMLWPDRSLRFDHHDLYIMGRDEVVQRMDKQGFDGNALADSTLEIADRCEGIEFKFGQKYLPKTVSFMSSDDYLEGLVFDGLEEKGLLGDQRYIDRAREELAILKQKGFSDYLLITWDIINEARSRGYYTGPGRGSAAGCLVAYALKITAMDPIRYKLLFGRFINIERNDFPDIDMDFEDTCRDEMKRYAAEKYGDAGVAPITTWTRWKAKALIRGVCKALAIPNDEVNKVCRLFETMEQFEMDATKAFRAANPEVLPLAQKYVGQLSGAGAHPSGVIISNVPLTDVIPIESRSDPDDNKKRVPVTAFDMDEVAELGFIKFDYLGLINLTVIHRTVDLIKERFNIDIDWEHLEPDDNDVLQAVFANGNTTGVFQMESFQYRTLLRDINVDSFQDLIASNALVRPGAFETVAKNYIKRKAGLEEVTYPHPSVEEYLSDTFGLAIYQEQVMQLAVYLGDFSWGEADKLRKIIGKKKDAAEFQPFYEKWMSGATKRISESEADRLWKEFEKHAGYSFNLSHAAAYTYIGYVTGWLKHYYPLEYLCSLINCEKNALTRMTYMLEAKRLGYEILAPDVNKSMRGAIVDDGGIRLGLTDIMNVGAAAADEIIKKRPFTDWNDWRDRTTGKCNVEVVAALVAVDAFESVPGAPREPNAKKNYQQYLNYPVDLESVSELGIDYRDIGGLNKETGVICGVTKGIKRTPTYVRIEVEDQSGAITVFGSMNNDLKNGEVVLALVTEKNMLGYARVDGLKERIENGNLNGFERYLIGDLFGETIKLRELTSIGGLDNEKSLVVPVSVRTIVTKKTKEEMAFVTLSDGEQTVTATAFARTWAQVNKLIREWEPICIKLGFLKDGGRVINEDGIADAYEILKRKLNA